MQLIGNYTEILAIGHFLDKGVVNYARNFAYYFILKLL